MRDYTEEQYARAEEVIEEKGFECENMRHHEFKADSEVILWNDMLFCCYECLGEYMCSNRGDAVEYQEFIEYIDEEVEKL